MFSASLLNRIGRLCWNWHCFIVICVFLLVLKPFRVDLSPYLVLKCCLFDDSVWAIDFCLVFGHLLLKIVDFILSTYNCFFFSSNFIPIRPPPPQPRFRRNETFCLQILFPLIVRWCQLRYFLNMFSLPQSSLRKIKGWYQEILFSTA